MLSTLVVFSKTITFRKYRVARVCGLPNLLPLGLLLLQPLELLFLLCPLFAPFVDVLLQLLVELALLGLLAGLQEVAVSPGKKIGRTKE